MYNSNITSYHIVYVCAHVYVLYIVHDVMCLLLCVVASTRVLLSCCRIQAALVVFAFDRCLPHAGRDLGVLSHVDPFFPLAPPQSAPRLSLCAHAWVHLRMTPMYHARHGIPRDPSAPPRAPAGMPPCSSLGARGWPNPLRFVNRGSGNPGLGNPRGSKEHRMQGRGRHGTPRLGNEENTREESTRRQDKNSHRKPWSAIPGSIWPCEHVPLETLTLRF